MQDTAQNSSVQVRYSVDDLLNDDLPPAQVIPFHTEPENLNVALSLAARGLAIFPVRDWGDGGGWKPIKGYPVQATTDPERIRAWWQRWPESRVALITGERNGISVLDVDRKNGKDGLATLEALGFPDIRATSPVLTRSPSGGWHVFFRYKPDLKATVGKIGPGLDVRNAGGFVIAPGSLKDGKRYAVEGAPLRHGMDLPEWPEALTPPAAPERAPAVVQQATEAQQEWAAEQLEWLAEQVAETPEGRRQSSLNDAALWAGGVAAHGALTCDDAEAALVAAGIACGLPEREAYSTFNHGWTDGLKKPIALPVEVEADDFDDLDDEPLLIDDLPSAKPIKRESRLLDPADPMPSARHMVRDGYTARDKLRTLQHYRGSFWAWDGACYRDYDEESARAAIWTYLERAQKTVTTPKGSKITRFKPSKSSVANVLEATKAVTNLPGGVEAPAWLDGATGPNPVELVPVANGLLHLPTGDLLPPTPAFFTLSASGVAFDPDAPEPVEWLRFLNQIWPDDQESIDALQEVFGYLLSADTSQQKIPLIVGPKRSGKGTIARVLAALIGQGNVVSPTLNSLATNFGAEPLIGKSVAIIGDARLSSKVDRDAITERLLGISGEDSQSIDRKYRGAWHGRLGVRFLVMTNELPALKDASGALAGRFLVLTMSRSFYGREDRGLAARLLSELPGVLNWAREGYLRLNRRGHFVPPASARESVEALEALGSPISAFIKDRCQVAPGLTVSCDDLHAAWREWCAKNRRDYPGTIASFGKDLHAAVPGLTVSRPRSDGQQIRHYNGIALNASEPLSSDPFDE